MIVGFNIDSSKVPDTQGIKSINSQRGDSVLYFIIDNFNEFF